MVELLRDTSLDVEQVDYADCIKTSAQNLLTIVNDVLDFSKIESGKIDVSRDTVEPQTLADKLVRGSRIVPVQARFAEKLALYEHDAQAVAAIRGGWMTDASPGSSTGG